MVFSSCETRPEQKFREHIKEDSQDAQAKRILKRDTASFDDKDDEEKSYLEKLDGGAMGGQLKDDKRSKSYEEREEEYERARARIFNQDSGSSQEGTIMIESPVRPVRGPLAPSSRQNSGTSDDSTYLWKQDRPWSSVDSSSGSERPSIPAVTKASSFAGSGLSTKILMRNDSSGSSRSSGSLGSRGSLCKLPRGGKA